ncbi:MAG: ABC transporter permease [Patescibacteria group bacterium]|nr:ABC transporter permease [Patescibacteria group bacterium]
MNSELRGILAIWYRELKVFQREKSRLVGAIVTPVLWLLLFGGGLGSAISITGVNYQAFIFPGILAQSVLFSSIFFGIYIVWDRKIDFLKEVLISPVSRFSIFAGKVVGGATDSLIQSMILLTIGWIFGATGVIAGLQIDIVKFVLCLIIIAFTTTALVSIGLAIGSMMDSFEGFQLISSFLLFPLFFLSGALFPIDKLPVWIAPFTFINPLTYSVDGMRSIILGASQFSVWMDFGVMAGFAALTLVVGAFAFERMKL